MGDGLRRTGLHTRQWGSVAKRLAWIAFAFYFPLLLRDQNNHRGISHGIIGILIKDFKEPRRAGTHAIPATIAFIRVNSDKVIPGSIAVSIIG